MTFEIILWCVGGLTKKTLEAVGFYSFCHLRAELEEFYFSIIPRSCGKQGTGHGHVEVPFPDGKEMKFCGVGARMCPRLFLRVCFPVRSEGEAEACNSSLGRSQRLQLWVWIFL